jgi:Fic family protein
MFAFDKGPAKQIDAVIAAAMLAFGFVYVHPLEDGNGRIHRYLIHHILTGRGCSLDIFSLKHGLSIDE